MAAPDHRPARHNTILYVDQVLMVTWPVTVEAATVSDRDRALPRLSKCSDLSSDLLISQ
jgi:dTDP-4-dehydrorhamnose 3,5-epimerase-like enzyme